MDADARRRAEHALGPWGERVVESTPETREELIRNVADAVAQAVQAERERCIAVVLGQRCQDSDALPLTVKAANHALRVAAEALDGR